MKIKKITCLKYMQEERKNEMLGKSNEESMSWKEK